MTARPPLVVVLTIVALACATVWTQPAPSAIDWTAHGADAGHRQYSPAAQLTPANVARLQVAWTYRTGDARPDGRSQMQCNPIVIDGVLYATSAQLKVFALDAATGRQRWVFDPLAVAGPDKAAAVGVSRGLTYWAEGDNRRIFMAAGP
ncbi:MAG: hypothetical protein ACR2LU_11050 [Luteitalea sp.]